MAANTNPEQPPILSDLLYSLPQELFDGILEEVFAEAPDQVVVIDKDYKPPSLLQVSRATRAEFAPSYYANSVFVLASRTADKFIDKVCIEHLKHINEVHTAESQQVSIRFREHSYRQKPRWAELHERKVLGLYCHTGAIWASLAEEGYTEKVGDEWCITGGKAVGKVERLPECCRELVEVVREFWARGEEEGSEAAT